MTVSVDTGPLDILRRLLEQPTAPFHEVRVLTVIGAILNHWGIPFRSDRHGNLIARYQNGRGPRWALMAHTDHPGIEITGVRGGTAHGTFLGGVRPDSLPGARVRLFCGDDAQGQPATITATRMVGGEKRVTIALERPGSVSPGAFGTFDLGAPTVNEKTVAAIAVDDLIGCATALSVLAWLKSSGARARVWGVFTRAEEVGFAGAQLLAEAGTLPRDTLVVSLEASKEMAGARQGMGPVIRVGDRTSTFNGDAEYRLHGAAKKLAEANSDFRFQRQLMSGGTCEATVFAALGYPAVGLAYPLVNYHNMIDDGGIAREQVATADYLGGVDLLETAVTAPAGDSLAGYYRRLTRATARYRKRLS